MPDTRWTLIQRIQARDGKSALDALGDLMKLYWEPLYHFARRRGESPADAEDAVQGYYEMLISRGSMDVVDRSRGRLRSFLLSSFDRYLIDQWSKRVAGKRGGGKSTLSLDQALAEKHFAAEPSHSLTPEHLFQKRWALTLVERVLQAIEADYKARGKHEVFLKLQGALEWNSSELRYAELGAELGINENAVKQAVFRMRKKFRELLRWMVAETVEDPSEVDGELAELVAVLGA